MRTAIGPLLVLLFAATASAQQVKIAVIPTQLEASAKGMVPELFDDYLLTAVQNTSGAQVIGQDDIGAMLGFEKQKDLINCDDTSCMADIGGALGVDKIVSVKVARLGEDWVATAKLINIKTTRVEQRVNEIVGGDVKALLHAVPRLVAKLFGKSAPDAGMETRPVQPATSVPSGGARPPPAVAPGTPNPSFGKGSRTLGTVFMLGGTAVALAGGYKATNPAQDCGTDFTTGLEDTSTCTDDVGDVLLGGVILVAGIVFTGVGAKQYANGKARAEVGNTDAAGRPGAYWLGWLLGGLSMVMPFAGGIGAIDAGTAELLGWSCGIGSLATFLIGGFAASETTSLSALPIEPRFGMARVAGEAVPTFGLGAGF